MQQNNRIRTTPVANRVKVSTQLTCGCSLVEYLDLLSSNVRRQEKTLLRPMFPKREHQRGTVNGTQFVHLQAVWTCREHWPTNIPYPHEPVIGRLSSRESNLVDKGRVAGVEAQTDRYQEEKKQAHVLGYRIGVDRIKQVFLESSLTNQEADELIAFLVRYKQ